MKLHVACGDVYLYGYINIDIKGHVLKSNELMEGTILSEYFKYPFGSPRREIIVDRQLDILNPWDFKTDRIEEIVIISAIEHFNYEDAKFIMSEIKRVLKPGGKLIIDFPDILKQVADYYEEDAAFMSELILCNHKDEYSIHRHVYTRKSFIELLGEGWGEIRWETVVEHSYPMQGCVAIKEVE